MESSRRERAAELSLRAAAQALGTAIEGMRADQERTARLEHVGKGLDALLGDLAGRTQLPLFTLHRHLIERARAAPCKEGVCRHTLSSRGGA
jgi:hypothetical protein